MGALPPSKPIKDFKPMPVPNYLRVEPAFLREKVWKTLTKKEQKLAYHLLRAGSLGRSLLFFQNHRNGLIVRDFLVDAFGTRHVSQTKKILGSEGFNEFRIYAAKYLDQAGPYSPSNRKYVLAKVTQEQLKQLLDKHIPKSKESAKEEILLLMTDPNYETIQRPEDEKGSYLEYSGGNLYQKGLKGEEVNTALGVGLKPDLNTRIVKNEGTLVSDPQTVKSRDPVGPTLKQIVAELEKAKALTATEWQKDQLEKTITYFKKGDVEDFRKANIAWVKDRSHSVVDVMLGWVEVYEDWLAKIASWESYVQIVDPKVSETAQKLASHAQYFEDNMPYGTFKKTFPKDYAPPAIMVYYLQEISSYRSGGYNLPNFDDIRRDVGAKNVIRLPLPGETEDKEYQSLWRETLEEYAPHDKVEALLNAREKIWQTVVLLHEIIGHGSGTYDASKFGATEDPISALGPLGSALEEQRADLAALVFAGDSKLVEVGIYRDQADAIKHRNLLYDFYLVDFLRRTSAQRTFSEAHQRGHWLFIKRLIEKKVIVSSPKDGKSELTPQNSVFKVVDYDKFKKVSEDLLGELQTIKANRDEKGLQQIFAKYAPLNEINEPWAQAVIERGEHLRINAGYIEQPWYVTSKGEFKSLGKSTVDDIPNYWSKFYLPQ